MKKLIMLAAALLCTQTLAYGAAVDSTGTTITVTGETGPRLGELPVFLLYPDYTFADITDDNTASAVAYANIVMSDQNGAYTVEIPAGRDLPMGVYTFLAGDETAPVYYAPAAEKQAATDIFCGGDAAAILEYLEDAERYYCITAGKQDFYDKYYAILPAEAKAKLAAELSEFNMLTDKGDMDSVLATIAAFNTQFQTAVLPAFAESGFSAIRPQITEENVFTVLEEYNGAFNIDLSVLADEDADINKAIRQAVYQALSKEEELTAEEIETVCHTAAALTKINSLTNRTAGTMRSILTTFQDVIGIDLTTGSFAELSESQQQQIFVKLAEHSDFETIEAFAAAFDQEVNNANTSNEKPQKPSGGSGGSSGGGGGGGAPSAFVPQPPVETTPLPDDDPSQPGKTGGFQDLEGYSWAADSIAWLAENGIVAGVSETEFCPGEHVTREEFVKMIVSAFKLELLNTEQIFTDVQPESWYFHYVNTAQKKGIVNGVSETEFGTGREISRQDMAVMLVNAMTYVQKLPAQKETDAFSDIDQVEPYAREAVSLLQGAEIIVGSDGRFDPAGTATRAEAAQIIYAALHQ